MLDVARFEPADWVSDEDAAAMQRFNDALARLAARRVKSIEIVGPLRRSKLAWLVATYQQPILYRFVALASGCAADWNAGNVLCSYLSARALIETVAVFLEYERKLAEHIGDRDLDGIGTLTINRTFAIRDKEWSDQHPGTAAVNVLTFIDNIDRRLLPGIRGHYDFMSERCHPNSHGHHQLFGRLDRTNNVVHYSESHSLDRHLNSILAAAVLIHLFETSLTHVDAAIIQVADLQHEIEPLQGAEEWTEWSEVR